MTSRPIVNYKLVYGNLPRIRLSHFDKNAAHIAYSLTHHRLIEPYQHSFYDLNIRPVLMCHISNEREHIFEQMYNYHLCVDVIT